MEPDAPDLSKIVRALGDLAAPWYGLAERYARFLGTAALRPLLLRRGAELPVLLTVIEALEGVAENNGLP